MARRRSSSIGRSSSCRRWWPMAARTMRERGTERPRQLRDRMPRSSPMSEALPNFEGLLREALAPVEPPAALAERVEATLMSITELAADELEAWELSAMRDPRNWVRPAAAPVAGGAPAPG